MEISKEDTRETQISNSEPKSAAFPAQFHTRPALEIESQSSGKSEKGQRSFKMVDGYQVPSIDVAFVLDKENQNVQVVPFGCPVHCSHSGLFPL